MPIVSRSFHVAICVLFFCVFFVTQDYAQAPNDQGEKLSPELAWRVEVLFRSKVSLPPAAEVSIGPRTASEIAGYDQISVVSKVQDKVSKPIVFLLSKNERSLIPYNKFDISGDPRTAISVTNRPSRGGLETAPVSIVVFDDLECPFCAQLNAALVPAVLDRYKELVRVVYMDFPSSGHPWALRAAIETSCLAKQSSMGYWSAVDTIHAQAGELGGTEHSLVLANDSLDEIVSNAGKQQHVDADVLNACIQRQDASSIDASRRLGESLGVERTPTFFINGAKIEGIVPADFLFHVIDTALVAEGKTPPGGVQVSPVH
jgi:protein-disulfide isomerase